MEVICLEEKAFYVLVEQVVARLKEKQGAAKEGWVRDEEAMKLLNIKSKSTLQEYRNQGKIRFTQPHKRIILYDRLSIEKHLADYANDHS